MHEVQPSEELAKLLHDFDKKGGIIDFVLIAPEADEQSEYEQYKRAVLFTLQVIGQRLEDSNVPFRLTFEPEKIVGQKISLTEFVGPLFDLDKRRLALEGKKMLNSFFYAGEEETPDNEVCQRNTPGIDSGYAYAFSNIPHSFGGTSLETNALFCSISHILFNDFAAGLKIYSWSTDWSNYFDAGHEWWGSFLWTVYNREQGFIVGIAASTTD